MFHYYRLVKNPMRVIKAFSKMDMETVEISKNLNLLPDPLKNLIWVSYENFIDNRPVHKLGEAKNTKFYYGFQGFTQKKKKTSKKIKSDGKSTSGAKEKAKKVNFFQKSSKRRSSINRNHSNTGHDLEKFGGLNPFRTMNRTEIITLNQ